jgi:hypothetical protein
VSTPAIDHDQLDAQLGSDAIVLRDACAGILKRWQYLQALGEDAVGQPRYTKANLAATVALIYFGRATQDDLFDFDDALALVRKGQ